MREQGLGDTLWLMTSFLLYCAGDIQIITTYTFPHFPSVILIMQNDVYSHLLQDLNKGDICTLNYFAQKYSQLKQTDIIQTFIGLYKEDRNQRFELLCHIAVVTDSETRIQNERYSNIQRGILVEKSNAVNTHAFKREHIKELKILAIFPNQMLVSQVENMLEFPYLNKTKEYVNKCVVLPKLIVENIAMAKNKSKKEEKPEKSVDAKKEIKGKAEEAKKGLKKTDSKSSIESQPKVPVQAKKVSSKQQSQPAPVHTHYQTQREKVEEQAVIKENPPKKKLCLDSDEDYYNPSDIAAQLNGNHDKNVETDHSGKKEHQKMDIESDNGRKMPVKEFIVDDDEDDDEDIFAKMDQAAKVQPDNKSTAMSNATCPKTEKPNIEVQKKVQPQKQAPKPASKPAPKPPAPAASKNSSLMGWVKVTK